MTRCILFNYIFPQTYSDAPVLYMICQTHTVRRKEVLPYGAIPCPNDAHLTKKTVSYTREHVTPRSYLLSLISTWKSYSTDLGMIGLSSPLAFSCSNSSH